MTTTKTYTWHGKHEFHLVGTDCHEDTLRIESNYLEEKERTLRLVLPTLCITYADMKFTNAIGGEQENYPASQVYGPTYFDPPVVISGEEDVEKLTWIRGAHRVTIGPDETEIEWVMGKALVIPRLRLDKREPSVSVLNIPDVPIAVDRELSIKVMQFGDGRHIGGVRVEKRHPEWKPKEEPKEYDLWIRVVDGETMEPMPETMLNLFRWDGKSSFKLIERRYTDGHGAIHDPNRPSDELEAVTLQRPGWRAVARCFRPLSGQRVRFHMRAWRLKKDVRPYVWSKGIALEDMALLTGYSPDDILARNGLSDPEALKPGETIKLPCYAATYRMEPGDTYEWLAEAFAYSSIEELVKHNKVTDPSELDSGEGISLPGWHFFYARPDESLERVDDMFGLPSGWSRTVGRVYHADPRQPYESETIAVPTLEFVEAHMKYYQAK